MRVMIIETDEYLEVPDKSAKHLIDTGIAKKLPDLSLEVATPNPKKKSKNKPTKED